MMERPERLKRYLARGEKRREHERLMEAIKNFRYEPQKLQVMPKAECCCCKKVYGPIHIDLTGSISDERTLILDKMRTNP